MSPDQVRDLKAYIDERFKPTEAKVDEMYQVFTAGKISSNVLRYALWTVSILVGMAVAIKELLRK